MNISAIELSFDESMMWLSLSDGRKLGVPLAYFPRLLRATPEQRLQYEMSGNGSDTVLNCKPPPNEICIKRFS